MTNHMSIKKLLIYTVIFMYEHITIHSILYLARFANVAAICRDPQTHTYFDILLHIYFQEHHLWKLNKAERWMVWPCLDSLEDMLEYSSGWHWCNYQMYLNMFTWNALKSSLRYWNNFFKLRFWNLQLYWYHRTQ